MDRNPTPSPREAVKAAGRPISRRILTKSSHGPAALNWYREHRHRVYNNKGGFAGSCPVGTRVGARRDVYALDYVLDSYVIIMRPKLLHVIIMRPGHYFGPGSLFRTRAHPSERTPGGPRAIGIPVWSYDLLYGLPCRADGSVPC
jgi:hypothetical protein